MDDLLAPAARADLCRQLRCSAATPISFKRALEQVRMVPELRFRGKWWQEWP